VTVTKRELVIRVANKLKATQNDVAKIVDGAFEALAQQLAEGERWELRDFGIFEVKTRAARIGRNPRTGEQVPVPERRVVTFRPGKQLREAVSRCKPQPEGAHPQSTPSEAPAPPPQAPAFAQPSESANPATPEDQGPSPSPVLPF